MVLNTKQSPTLHLATCPLGFMSQLQTVLGRVQLTGVRLVYSLLRPSSSVLSKGVRGSRPKQLWFHVECADPASTPEAKGWFWALWASQPRSPCCLQVLIGDSWLGGPGRPWGHTSGG